MIILVTTPGRNRTVQCMRDGTFGVKVPDVRTTDYDRLFRAWSVPRATYIFTDFERLYPRELKAAADLYRRLKAAGMRCLNDPALAMSRAELLTMLERRGINPFGVHRADTGPAPRRFPVFIREEMGHVKASPDLFHDQAALDRALRGLQASGTPLRGQLVIELAAEPYADGLWAKWGTWRIGEAMVVEHVSVDDTWLVKTGDKSKLTDVIAAEEDDAVFTNRFAAELAPAFELAHIEYGRADHGRFCGRPVLYEINSNPYINPLLPTKANPRRSESRLFSRRRIAESLEAIDTPRGGRVSLRNWRDILPWSEASRKARPSLRP
jgi:hypothetical protein